MIREPGWRKLIYRLSEEHKTCLLLNFAIQQISDAGYQAEITSVPAASTYLDVFGRVLRDAVLQLMELEDYELGDKLPDFIVRVLLPFVLNLINAVSQKVCTSGEHIYLFAQVFLHRLTSEPNAAAMQRLAQELEQSVANQYALQPILRSTLTLGFYSGEIARATSILLAGVSQYPKVTASLSSILLSKSTTAGDILTVGEEPL